jgi:hypothetical protein
LRKWAADRDAHFLRLILHVPFAVSPVEPWFLRHYCHRQLRRLGRGTKPNGFARQADHAGLWSTFVNVGFRASTQPTRLTSLDEHLTIGPVRNSPFQNLQPVLNHPLALQIVVAVLCPAFAAEGVGFDGAGQTLLRKVGSGACCWVFRGAQYFFWVVVGARVC